VVVEEGKGEEEEEEGGDEDEEGKGEVEEGKVRRRREKIRRRREKETWRRGSARWKRTLETNLSRIRIPTPIRSGRLLASPNTPSPLPPPSATIVPPSRPTSSTAPALFGGFRRCWELAITDCR
jgi:hypothetical protein